MGLYRYARELLHSLTKLGVRPMSRKIIRKERLMQRKVESAFKEQADFVVARSRKLLAGKAVKATSDEIDGIFDDMDDAFLIESITVVAGDTMKMGADYRIRKMQLGEIGISFDLKHPLAVQYLQSDRPLVLAKMKNTTKEHIKPILEAAVAEGKAPGAVAKEIMENYAFSKTRALMIATNEVGHAYEWGNFAVMDDVKQQGYTVEKEWLTVGDDRVEQVCQDNQDQSWIGYDDNFASGDQTAPTSEHPNCRCTTLYQYK